MKAVTHLEKVIAGEVSAVTHLEKVIAQETAAVTYTEKVIAGTVPPVTHLQKVIAGVAKPVTHLEYVWAGGSPASVQEYTGAVPVTFIADGTPLLDYIISGNTVQSGTPTPDSPIMPEGTGDRTGNLFDKTATNTNNGYIPNGYVRADGTENTNRDYRASEYISVDASTAYTLYCVAALNAPSVCFYDSDKNFISGVPYSGRVTVPFTTPQNAAFLRLSYRAIDEDAIMLNTGSTPLPYESYGYKIPISSAGQTTPVYLGEVETTRLVKKLVLTGEESWYKNNNASTDYSSYFYTTFIAGSSCIGGNGKCTHFMYKNVLSDYDTIAFHIESGYGALRFRVENSMASTITDFKQYLSGQYAAGHPVTVWYVLATPETAVVNEPLMKIGDYADTLSMEQAGVSIPTANGSTTLDVETTVPPSEIYIKYRGEAVTTLSSLPAEVSSPEATEEVNPEETEEEENGSEDISLQHEFEAIE